MKKIIFSVLPTMVLITSCAGRVAADAETKAALRPGQTIQVAMYGPSKIQIVTPPGFIGGPISMLLGALLHASNTPSGTAPGPIDPAPIFAKDLVQKYFVPMGANVTIDELKHPLPFPDDDTPRSSASANCTFEVAVPLQQFTYGALHWSTYYYQNAGVARLVDNSTGRVVWSQQCQVAKLFGDDEASLSLDKDAFSANEGRRVNEILEYAAHQCAQKMSLITE